MNVLTGQLGTGSFKKKNWWENSKVFGQIFQKNFPLNLFNLMRHLKAYSSLSEEQTLKRKKKKCPKEWKRKLKQRKLLLGL